MTVPEPVDETLGGTVETRGGDRLSDAVPAILHPGEYIVPRGVIADPEDEDE